ncbi:MAG TPA: nitrite/sulfite reductase [Blastocatellia bacterium]|nr:nitrite/sulfite reductase [Blastocatellia bacterium]
MNKIEEIKRRKDGLDVLGDIYRYSKLGPQTITPDDEPLFRWYGIYSQRPAEDGFFMVRIRIPGGDLTPAQLRLIAALADEHGRGLADITVRQNIQLHWVRIESLADILDRLREAGLSTTEACGDCVRNILNCPVSGVDESELYDTTALVREVNDFFVGNRDFSNLPRKFKIAITGCAVRCVYPEINDIGIFAVREEGRTLFRARIGGGLSTTPRFSKDLEILMEPEEVVDLCGAVASVFRDEGNRENRKRARLKFLIEKWEIPRFRAEVEARLGRSLRRSKQPEAAPIIKRDRSHLGIHRQREAGLYYAGISILGGRTSASDLARLAAVAEEYGSGRMRTTNTQNIVLLDIDERRLVALRRDLKAGGFDCEPSWSRKAVIACTGIQFCKLAIAETKNRAAELSSHLEQTINLDDSVRISVTGCPNSCGQHHICDVGLEGSVTTIDGVKRETFQVFLGGGVGAHETFGRRIGVRVPSEQVAESLARLFAQYKEGRIGSETFQEFCLRHSDKELARYMTESEARSQKPEARISCELSRSLQSGRNPKSTSTGF